MAELVVEAQIERIELFEDRAAVTRRVAVPAATGRVVLRIPRVSPLVTERHLVWPGTSGVLVEEARVERRRTTRQAADPQVAARLHERKRELEAAIGALEDAARRAAEQVTRAGAAVQAALGWSPRLLAAHEPLATVEALRELAERRTLAHRAAGEAEEALAEARRELSLVAASLEAARVGAPVWTCDVVVQARVDGPEPALRVRYTVPCALWRPIHRATLRVGPSPRVAWEVGAMVWNATREDWRGVTLVCSTARPGDHATPPVLTDDLLRTRRREQQIVVEAREEVVQVAREGEARRTSEVPGVDDGGEPRTYTAPLPVDLPSDGQPVHVRLESWEAEASVAWLAHPERSAQVVMRSRQPNAASRPLLAGPVDLYTTTGADGLANAVGRARIGFVPPGEPFALGWGSHDAVRVTRRSEAKVERARLTGRQAWRFSVVAKVANLGAEPVEVDVRERLPVSEIGEVTVQPPTATPALDNGPDRDGLCTWRLALAAGEVRELTLAYVVEAPASVRLEGAFG